MNYYPNAEIYELTGTYVYSNIYMHTHTKVTNKLIFNHKTQAVLVFPQKNARKLDKPVHEMRILLSIVVWTVHIAMLRQMAGDLAQSRKVCF